jgi:NADH:ubiquinone oxidoreductase subunit 3 (subunit A)
MFVALDVMAMFLYVWAVGYRPLTLEQSSSWVMVILDGAV